MDSLSLEHCRYCQLLENDAFKLLSKKFGSRYHSSKIWPGIFLSYAGNVTHRSAMHLGGEGGGGGGGEREVGEGGSSES